MDAIVQPSSAGGSSLSATLELAKPDFADPPKIGCDHLKKLLQFCVDNRADDLVLISGTPWALIWSEEIRICGDRPLYKEELEQLVVDMSSNANAAIQLSRAEDLDFSYPLTLGRGKSIRFRTNASACLEGIEIVMRPSGKIPPTLDELGVPAIIKDNALPKSGIVLICGPTGSGKTTLLDAIMREQLTQPKGRHVLTYYAPIESDLSAIPNRTGIVAQQEIGVPGFGAHLTSFPRAVRNALRRHPMVIAFGEARDKPTIEGALLSSMTGHTTYTTTHTANTHMAIPRMADAFDGADRIRITNSLIDNCRMIVHQRLLRRPSGIGRAPVRSALVLTQDIRSELLRTSVDHLPAAMYRATIEEGLGLLQDAVAQFEKGQIHEDELYALERELKSEAI